MDPMLESQRETLKLLMEINSIPIEVQRRDIKEEMERIGVTEMMRKQARALRMVGSVDAAKEVERVYLNGEEVSIADLGDEDEMDEEEETDEEESDEMEDGESDEMEEEESDENEEGQQMDEHLESGTHWDPLTSHRDPL